MQSILRGSSHAHRQNAACILRHIQGITYLIVIEGTIEYNHPVNSFATVASIMQNRALVNQMCVCE